MSSSTNGRVSAEAATQDGRSWKRRLPVPPGITWGRTPQMVFNDPDLTGTAKNVYGVLSMYARGDDEGNNRCILSSEGISKELAGISWATVRSCLRQLVKRGWIGMAESQGHEAHRFVVYWTRQDVPPPPPDPSIFEGFNPQAADGFGPQETDPDSSKTEGFDPQEADLDSSKIEELDPQETDGFDPRKPTSTPQKLRGVLLKNRGVHSSISEAYETFDLREDREVLRGRGRERQGPDLRTVEVDSDDQGRRGPFRGLWGGAPPKPPQDDEGPNLGQASGDVRDARFCNGGTGDQDATPLQEPSSRSEGKGPPAPSPSAPPEPPDPAAPGHLPTVYGERHPFARLTRADVAAIRERYPRGGITQRALATQYDVSQATIWELLHHQTWVHAALEDDLDA